MSPPPALPDSLRTPLPVEVQSYLSALEAQVEALSAQVAELTRQLTQTSQTSSRPPSSDPPSAPPRAKRPASGRARGGQKGHRGQHRALKLVTEVDAIEDHWPSACPHCRSALPPQAARGVAPRRQQVWDIPPITPHVVEHRYQAVDCPGCQHRVRAERPVTVPPGAFGPRLSSLVGLLVGRYRLSHRETVRLLAEAFGVELSLGQVTATCRQLSGALGAPYALVQTQTRTAAYAHVDETGWNQRGARRWLWVAVTAHATLFSVAARRRAAEVNHLVGASYQGIVISDRFRAYHARAVSQRQVCWAHLKRDLEGYRLYPDPTGAWGQRALEVVAQVFALWHRFRAGELTRPHLQADLHPLQAALTALWAEGASLPARKARGFCAAMQSLDAALWTFSRVAGVEPTNNAAERALRPAVLWRKGSFGAASDDGQRFVERILTVIATCRQQQRHVLTFLTDALSAHWAGRPAPCLLTT